MDKPKSEATPGLAWRPWSQSQAAQVPEIPRHDRVYFPKVYEDAWGGDAKNDQQKVGGPSSAYERARIFLLRIAKMLPPEQAYIFQQVRRIITDPQNRSVLDLAVSIKQEIFGGRHTSFATSPLLQVVRFMLLKANIAGPHAVADSARAVVDFFFDPTLARNLKPLPFGETVTYQYHAGRLRVVIVGGGPTALASAIALAEKGAGTVDIHMYERRWVRNESAPGVGVCDYPPTARRRDQVVTLQDSVTRLLSKATYEALFAGRPEPVWPGSANIQIRKVEDRLLKRIQAPEFKGVIHLHPEALTRETLNKVGDYHVLLGADGAASWVRKNYFNGYENERGRSYALGLAFDRPAGLPWSQSLNVFLTLGQTRYLLNASDFDGRGYLNMQLTESEWHKMVSVDGEPVHFGRPGCLRKADGSIPAGFEEHNVFAPSEDRESALWIAIRDGLRLFGFKEEEVINVVRIPIVVQAVKEGTQYLPAEDLLAINRPTALAAVAGDAAMTVHFWPGRGLNSGIKEGLAFGDELTYALREGRFIGMPISALKQYNDFILKLQNREHDKRSIPILNQSGSPEALNWLLDRASSVPDQVATEWLIGAMVQIADRLEGRSDWHFPTVANVEPQLRIILRQLHPTTIKEMAVSFPWPTREMAGAEVMPLHSLKTEEKQQWLSTLWGVIRDEKKREARNNKNKSLAAGEQGASSGRFETRKTKINSLPKSPPPEATNTLQVPATLKRSNASTRSSRGRPTSTLSDASSDGRDDPDDDEQLRSRSPSPGPPPAPAEMNLARMLTVHRKPPKAALNEAMTLALFRIDEPVAAS